MNKSAGGTQGKNPEDSEYLQFRKTELIHQLEPQLQNAKIGSKIQNLKTIATTAPSETFLKEHKCASV